MEGDLNLNQLIEDLARFHQCSTDIIVQELSSIRKIYPHAALPTTLRSQEIWRNKSVDSLKLESVEQFWKTEPCILLELVEAALSSGRMTRRLLAAVWAIASGTKTILDYGAGVGEDVKYAREVGLHAIAYEPEGQQSEFIAFRNLPVINAVPTVPTYDMVWCFEVFPHMVDPFLGVQQIYDCLNPRGILLTTWRFRGSYDLALSQHSILEETFVDYIKSIGFHKLAGIEIWPGKTLHAFGVSK